MNPVSKVRAQMPSPSKDSAESFLKKGLENLKLKPSIVFEDTSKATAAWSKTEKFVRAVLSLYILFVEFSFKIATQWSYSRR